MSKSGMTSLARVALSAAVALGTASASSQSLVLAQAIDLPGVSGRIDHVDIDLEGNRLFVAALAAGSLEVIDLRAGRVVARLVPGAEPQGVAYLPARHRIVVASGGSRRVVAHEAAPSAVASVGNLGDADNLRFDARSDRLWVGYGRALAVLDPQTLAVAGRIEWPGHPEAFEFEPAGRRVFVNVPSAGQVVLINRQSATIASTRPASGASGNFPMALDEASSRLHIATRKPALLQTYDTTTDKRVAELPICADADDLFFDGQRRQLYAVCGQGVVEVSAQRGTDRHEVIERLQTAPGARTGLFVPRLSTLFVAVSARAGAAAQIRAYAIK